MATQVFRREIIMGRRVNIVIDTQKNIKNTMTSMRAKISTSTSILKRPKTMRMPDTRNLWLTTTSTARTPVD